MNNKKTRGRPLLGAEYRNTKQEPAEVRAISETHVVLFFPERIMDAHLVVLRGEFSGEFSTLGGATNQ